MPVGLSTLGPALAPSLASPKCHLDPIGKVRADPPGRWPLPAALQRWTSMVSDSRLGFEMYEALPHLCKPLT